MIVSCQQNKVHIMFCLVLQLMFHFFHTGRELAGFCLQCENVEVIPGHVTLQTSQYLSSPAPTVMETAGWTRSEKHQPTSLLLNPPVTRRQ